MRLLHWSTLKPEQASGIAAVRFLRPVRLSTIRLFPDGAKPFENAPEIVAETKPESFFVEMFVHVMDKGKTWLLPTRMAYPGGLVDFNADMADETLTRLLAFKGDFEAMSIAIYGEFAPTPPEAPSDEVELLRVQRRLPPVEPTRLSKSLDPANAQDPTFLAKQLLAISTEYATLPEAIRLAFCLKPAEEEWESPELLPFVMDLHTIVEGQTNLEDIVQMMRKPIPDDTTEDDLNGFADIISRSSNSENDYAFHVANLLSISASQNPELARAMLRKLEPWSIYTTDNLDQGTLLCLLDAATNVDVARHLNNGAFLETLQEVANNFKAEKPAQVAATRLATRIRQWAAFEDALTNPHANINEACGLLKEVAKEEQALGIWLESIITHEDISSKSIGAALPTSIQDVPIIRFHDQQISISQEEFLTLVRAFVGVASVLAMWVWSDELRHDSVQERALGVLRLWQSVDGYREITNYLFLQRTATRRLNWIRVEGARPQRSNILAEEILFQLCNDDPYAILHEEVLEAVVSFKSPLLSITDTELDTLQKLAYISEDGLHAAVEELVYRGDRPISLRGLRILRVALASVGKALDKPNGLWTTMRAFLDLEEDRTPTLAGCLVDVLADVSADLTSRFPLTPLPQMDQSLVALFFSTAEDLINLLIKVFSAFLDEPDPTLPLSSRGLRSLVTATADVFSAADLALEHSSPSSILHISAGSGRQASLDLVIMLSAPDIYVDAGVRKVMGAKVVLQTLLVCCTYPNAQRSNDLKNEPDGRDPVHRVLQMYAMIDNILPAQPTSAVGEGATIIVEEDVEASTNDSAYWLEILPDLLHEIRAFFAILDSEKKVLFMHRLVGLDQPDGVIGIGEWLLMEEIDALSKVFSSLSNPDQSESVIAVKRYQANLGLEFLKNLVLAPASVKWITAGLASSPDLARALSTCLLAALDCDTSSSNLSELLSQLSRHAPQATPEFIPELRLALALGMLHEALSASVIQQTIDTLEALPDSVVSLCMETIRRVIGRTLAICSKERSSVTIEMDRSLFKLISWLGRQSNPRFTMLSGISAYGFQSLCSSISAPLSPDDRAIFTRLRGQFTTDPESPEPSPSIQPNELPSSLSLPIHQIQNMLEGQDGQQLSTPSTPPRQKAGTKTPDILGVIISPPTALLRAQPAATTGLTKTYLNNDFRQLRQTPSSRQNTSRLPSMHVDDFQVQETVPAVPPGIPIMGLPTNPEMLGYPPILDMDQL